MSECSNCGGEIPPERLVGKTEDAQGTCSWACFHSLKEELRWREQAQERGWQS
jgi:hypothetical protein